MFICLFTQWTVKYARHLKVQDKVACCYSSVEPDTREYRIRSVAQNLSTCYRRFASLSLPPACLCNVTIASLFCIFGITTIDYMKHVPQLREKFVTSSGTTTDFETYDYDYFTDQVTISGVFVTEGESISISEVTRTKRDPHGLPLHILKPNRVVESITPARGLQSGLFLVLFISGRARRACATSVPRPPDGVR